MRSFHTITLVAEIFQCRDCCAGRVKLVAMVDSGLGVQEAWEFKSLPAPQAFREAKCQQHWHLATLGTRAVFTNLIHKT